MKKFFAAIFLLLILSSVSYAASSEDVVYVRQDVFDAKMEALFLRLHSEIENLGNKINGRFDALTAEMKGNVRELSARIDGIEKRMDTMNTFLYYLLVLLAALIVLPYVNKWLEGREIKKQQSITLEDVKRLIAEAKLSGVPQV
ncbi:MAG: hypothetical protein IJ597_01000 [Synergistaceae bacterium]|nr:hypothetical protein [Synergistaceae bacterium]